MNHKQVAITAVAAVGLLAIGIASASVFAEPSFNKRWNGSMKSIAETQAPIPHEKLHARALEILQERADAVKAAAAATNEDRAPVVAESVPLPRPDPRK